MKVLLSQRYIFDYLFTVNSLAFLGNYSCYPLLAVFFLKVLHLPPSVIASLLMYIAIVFKLSRVIFAPILNKIMLNNMIVLAMFLCAIGYTGLAFSSSTWSIFFWLTLVAIGFGANSLTVRVITSLVNTTQKSLLLRFTSLSVGTNIAAAIGPILGNAMMITFPHYGLYLCSAAIFYFAAIIALFFRVEILTEVNEFSLFKGLMIHFKSAKLINAMLLATFGWFLYAQFITFLPIMVSEKFGKTQLIGTLFSLNAIIVIIFSVPISKYAEKINVISMELVITSFFIFTFGFLLLSFIQNLISIYSVIIIWSFAEILMMPALLTIVAEYSNAHTRIIAFAFNSIAAGIGEGVGNYFGVTFSHYAIQYNAWYFVAKIFLLLAMTLAIISIWANQKTFRATYGT